MPLSADQARDAMRARSLLENPIFTETLDELRSIEMDRAILSDDAMQREASRQIVLAIGRIRGALEAVVAIAESEREREALERSFEDVVE